MSPLFWPWWCGALGLAASCLGCFWLLRRPLGVSGLFAAAISPGETLARERAESAMGSDAAGLRAALLAETRAQFGDAAAAEVLAAEPPPAAPAPAGSRAMPWTAQVTFLVAICAGALGVAWAQGTLQLHFDLGSEFARVVASGWRMWPVLIGGGFLVGWGTRMAGGCTSGHGLSGCGRLRISSLVATATFFGTAIAVSYALGALS